MTNLGTGKSFDLSAIFIDHPAFAGATRAACYDEQMTMFLQKAS